jgi:hypothetical protein
MMTVEERLMKFWLSGNRVWISTFVFFFLLACSTVLMAQTQTGRLRGEIVDATGAVIPGASITVKNSSGLVVSATSDGAGAYDVKNLAPGKYSVTVTAKGFAPTTREVEIAAGQLKEADIPLAIVVKEEDIEVQSDSARVSTSPDSNASSLVLSGKDLDALSDDPDELQSELQALAGPSAGPNGGQIYIDGFTGGQLPPKSSIREIRINQNPFSAQYDRMGFGRIEILTKPGTDKLHGQFFFNDNHSFMDALNPFASTEPDFSTQMVSGNVGGPLGKKLSYQINAERRNINEAAVVFPGAFAAANQPVIGVLNPRVRTNVSTRFDYQLSASNTLMARYQFTHNHEENDGITQLALPSQGYNQTGNENEIQISDTQILSPHAINETRFEWERGATDQNSLFLTPAINVLGQFTEGGNPLGISSVITNHYELQNYTSINKGNHFLRLGGRLRVTGNSSLSTQNFNGTFTFGATKDPVTQQTISPLTNFKNGTPTQLTVLTGNPLIQDTFADAGLYAEDDWKIRPNMTASYGLRFETQNGIKDHGNWAPRIGFAWGLGGKKNAAPKTVIRTGFGLFYDRFSQNLIMQAERLNGINQQQVTITVDPNNASAANAANRALLASLFASYPNIPALPGTQTTTYSIDPALRTPYTVQFAGSVERQLTKTATLTGTYIHSHGIHQLFSSVLTPTPSPQYQFESGGVFNQNQMILSFNMRAGTRLTIFSFYMFGHANSDTAGANTFPSDPARGISADYGRAAFDVRQRLFFGGTVALPHGFRVSPFMVANSGAPFNIITGTDLNGDSIFNDRPAFANGATGPTVVDTSFGSFNTSPGPGQITIPSNFGSSPAQFTLNMRLSKTIGIGPKLEAANTNPQEGQGGQHTPGAHGGGEGRGPGGGQGMGGPRGRGGPFGGPERSNQRYSLTFSANARNIFNHVNPAPPIGNLSSALFGQSTALAGGVFNTQSANRRVDLQVMFSF